ncbi:MAG: hypothetical protein HC783_14285 [Rhodobacteraceae bacterium]|nr:hypothetical protein [Paracoccaceae bacterium]
MTRLLLVPLALAIFVLVACTRDEHWHQRLTLVIDTPTGQVIGSVVQRIDIQAATGLYKTTFQGVDPSSTSVRVTGEALAVEITPGRWLFALLKGDQGWQGEPGSNAGYAIAVPLGHFARSPEGVDAILAFPKDTPIPLPPEAWPMLVTFDDITRPETVRRVDPADLAEVFGEGIRLEMVTLEITEDLATERQVDSLLEWLGPYPEPSLGPADEPPVPISKAPFYRRVHMGDFVRRP